MTPSMLSFPNVSEWDCKCQQMRQRVDCSGVKLFCSVNRYTSAAQLEEYNQNFKTLQQTTPWSSRLHQKSLPSCFSHLFAWSQGTTWFHQHLCCLPYWQFKRWLSSDLIPATPPDVLASGKSCWFHTKHHINVGSKPDLPASLRLLPIMASHNPSSWYD